MIPTPSLCWLIALPPGRRGTMTPMPSVSEISDRFVDELAALDPAHGARMMGIDINGSRLRDYSPTGSAAIREMLLRARRELDHATADGEAERLGAIYLRDVLAGRLAMSDANEDERDLSILSGPPSAVRMSFDLVDPEGPEDWEAVTIRLEGVPAAMTGYRTSLQAGMDGGRVASKRCAAAVAEQCAVWAGSSGHGWFSTFAESKGDAPGAERLRRAGRAADAAYGELSDWLRSAYVPGASETDGVGRDAYQVWARYFLGSDLDVEEAYEWGWDELGRLETEQRLECQHVQSGADFAAVREMLTTDPGRAVHGVDAWQGWLQDLTDRTTDELDGSHFDIAPALRTCTVSIPPEGSAAAPYYTPPSEDLSSPGRIWFPTMGRTAFPTWDAVTTVFHEAVPGHHLQLGATRLIELTRAQQLGFNSAHGEGWALYAERLMDELGRLDKPEYRLGFLSMQAFRAARVVVDIGLHTGQRIPAGRPRAGSNWDYDAAVEYLGASSGLSRAFCESEALRYLSWPTQATTYKLGERVWLEGRQRARQNQGERFDLKAWHGAALALGPLGLDDLARELERLAVGMPNTSAP